LVVSRRWFGFPGFSLASAFCLRASCVAPVRGGTYFSLPRQRKVGKRKPLTPPTLLPSHGPPTAPSCLRQGSSRCPLPTPRINASLASRSRVAARAINLHAFYIGKLCVGFRAVRASLRTGKQGRCRKSADVCSATTYTQFAT
jgi:hypothetical protein